MSATAFATHDDTATFIEGLEVLKIGDVWPRSRRVVSLRESDTVAQALAALDEHQILSMPVFKKENSKEFVGIVDTLDVALFVVGIAPKDIDWTSMSDDDVTRMLQVGKKFEDSTVGDVLELKRAWKRGYQHDFVFSLDTPLNKIVEAFYQGVHRILVVDSDGNLYNVLSQSDLCAIIGQVMPLLSEEIRNKPVSNVVELGKIVTASADKPAIRILSEDLGASSDKQSLSAVPLVDQDGRIVGTLSSSNLLGLDHRTFDDLAKPALAYITFRDMGSRSFRSALSSHMALHPVTIQPFTTLQDALSRMLAVKTHRLWIVDADNKPQGVLSMGDIFSSFLPWANNK